MAGAFDARNARLARVKTCVRSIASLTFTLGIVTMAASYSRAQSSAGWLDRPLAQWNPSGAVLPVPASGAESSATLARRCASNAIKGATADAVSKAGWVPFLHQDRSINRDDIEELQAQKTSTMLGGFSDRISEEECALMRGEAV